MFLMSNWSLLRDIYNGWVLGLGAPSIPVVSLILVLLSVLVAAETIFALRHKGRGEAEAAEAAA